MNKRRLISFDWALKRLLRSKANFDVLEGFLSELLSTDIRIVAILESESNKENVSDKYNRVDLKVKNAQYELLLVPPHLIVAPLNFNFWRDFMA